MISAECRWDHTGCKLIDGPEHYCTQFFLLHSFTCYVLSLSSGSVECDTGRSFLVEVPDQSRATLEPIITEWAQPSTRILSDGSASYYNLKHIHGGIYDHDVVVHEWHFMDPDDESIHTQNIENK